MWSHPGQPIARRHELDPRCAEAGIDRDCLPELRDRGVNGAVSERLQAGAVGSDGLRSVRLWNGQSVMAVADGSGALTVADDGDRRRSGPARSESRCPCKHKHAHDDGRGGHQDLLWDRARDAALDRRPRKRRHDLPRFRNPLVRRLRQAARDQRRRRRIHLRRPLVQRRRGLCTMATSSAPVVKPQTGATRPASRRGPRRTRRRPTARPAARQPPARATCTRPCP